MSKILALDLGIKRTGIAITDELQIIASGLTTVDTTNLLDFLKEIIVPEKIELFVVGRPKTLDNKPSENDVLVTKWIKVLNKEYPDIPIVEVDERFTSKIAFKTMIDSGLSKKRRKNIEN